MIAPIRTMNMKHALAFIALTLLLCTPAMAQQKAAGTRETTPQEEIVYRVTLGKVQDVKMLLKKVGNPNMTDNMGWPLLSIAASRTDEEGLPLVKMLVENGADVNYHGGTFNYPLMFAVQSGNQEIVQYLLDQGADYRVKDAYGVKVIDFARAGRNKEVQRIISDRVDADVETLSMKRSQEYLDKITYDLAYHSCALQYYGFYYKSRQDPIPLEVQKTTMDKHKKIIGTSISELMMLFRVPHPMVMDVFNGGRKAMFGEMENLISNRWRRIKGVGKDGDMEERCTRLTLPWKEKVFDKEIMDQQL